MPNKSKRKTMSGSIKSKRTKSKERKQSNAKTTNKTINKTVNKTVNHKKTIPKDTKLVKSKAYSDKYVNKIHKMTGINFLSGSEITTKVETLTGADVHQLIGNYAVVDKADGLRTVLYLGEDKTIRMLNEKQFKDTDIKCKGSCIGLTESLIDTEFIPKINTFFVFDVLVFHGEDVRKLPFEKRHELLLKFKNVSWESESYDIKVKNYEVDYEDFFKACKKVYQAPHPYELDGLVFTPLKADYASKSLKWKPLKDLTIDFIVRIKKTYQDKGKTYLILDLFNSVTRPEMYKNGLRFPRGYYDYFPMINNTFYAVPYPFMPEYDSKHSYCVIEVTARKSVSKNFSYSGDETMNNFEYNHPEYFYKKVETINGKRATKLIPIMDNSIVEMNYDIESKERNPAKKWVPYRFRRDRTVQYWTNLYYNEKKRDKTISGPNAKRKADVIWKMYQNPITTKMMFGEEPLPKLYYTQTNIDRSHTRNLVFFHLYIKEKLYETHFYYKNYSENLLELSAGDGSDAANIIKQMPGYVLMIDIIDTSLTKAAIDFKKFQNKFRKYNTKLDTLALDLREESVSKIGRVAKRNDVNKFDVVSIQFSFHYMMETKESFKNLFNTLKTYTQPGGFYFMTCFDGATVYKELKKTGKKIITVEGDPDTVLYGIERMYDKNTPFDELDMFGTPIKVSIHTIGRDMIEYMVNFKKLVAYFKKNGFDLIDTKMFSKVAPEWEKTNKDKRKLSKPEQEFSFLNRYAVFQRKY
jgi:SAM-dependent methyltransferase